MRRHAMLGLVVLAACTKPIEQQWVVATEGASKCTPALVGELVVFGNEGGYVHAFDKEGAGRWSFTAHRDVIGSPVSYRELVLFGAVNNIFYAVHQGTGREAWKFMAKDRIKGGPTLAGDRVVFGSYDKRLYALEAATGKLAWHFPPPPPPPPPAPAPTAQTAKDLPADPKLAQQAKLVEPLAAPEPAPEPIVTGEFSYARPLVVDGVIYVGNLDGHLYAIDAATGQLRWRFKTGGGITSGAIHDAGVLYFGSNDHHLYALDLKTRQPRWKLETGDEVNASPRLADGVLYVGGVDKTFYAVDAATGKTKWKHATGGRIVGAAAVYRNLVFTGSGPGDGRLYALDRASGKVFWTFETQAKVDADLVVEGDRLYVVVGDGRLFTFKINKTS